MERKMLKKEVNGYYSNVISVGYCDLYYLLKCLDREGWTCGVYGWNADIFEVNKSTAIVTGYRPFGNISSNKYELNNKYNEKARKIWNNSKMKYETKVVKVKLLLEEYTKEVLGGVKKCGVIVGF